MPPDPLLGTWSDWRSTGSEDALGKLLVGLRPTLASETRKYLASGLPPVSIDIEAKRIAMMAMKSYDPKKGVLIKTYVSSRLPGLKRFVDSHQKVGRIPEHMTQSAATIKNAQESLISKYEREPSVQELAEEVGWPEGQVVRTLPFVRKDLPESGFDVSLPMFEAPWENKVMEQLHFFHKSLIGPEQVAIESFLGLHGKKATTDKEAARVSGLPLSKVRKLRSQVKQQIGKVKWA